MLTAERWYIVHHDSSELCYQPLYCSDKKSFCPVEALLDQVLPQLKGFLITVTNNGMKKGEYDVGVELGEIRGTPVQKLMVKDQS